MKYQKVFSAGGIELCAVMMEFHAVVIEIHADVIPQVLQVLLVPHSISKDSTQIGTGLGVLVGIQVCIFQETLCRNTSRNGSVENYVGSHMRK